MSLAGVTTLSSNFYATLLCLKERGMRKGGDKPKTLPAPALVPHYEKRHLITRGAALWQSPSAYHVLTVLALIRTRPLRGRVMHGARGVADQWHTLCTLCVRKTRQHTASHCRQ